MQVTSEQAHAQNTKIFRDQYTVLHKASVGVVLTRSREPYRAIDALREFAFSENGLDFGVWTISKGWEKYDRAKADADPSADSVIDVIAAMRKLGDPQAMAGGVYVMMYPHYYIAKAPILVQMIKEYARAFAENRKRLILLCPPGTTLPAELEDDVVILDFEVPSYNELISIYERIMQTVPPEKRPAFKGEDKGRLISLGSGMTAHEYETALSRSLVTNRLKLPNVLLDDFADVLTKVKTEVVKRSEVLELMPSTSMSNVGGLEGLKTWISKRKRAFSQEAKDFGIEAPKGIALIGPPGTGKTLGAKAISSELGLPLIKLDVGRIFNSLVGASEQRIRGALKMVDNMAPCVLMIDEVDKALGGSHTGGGDSGVAQRVLGALLTWMQETKEPVFMVVTANRVQNLPSEFLRKGRLDEVFAVTVPEESERLDILGIHLRIRGHDPEAVEGLEMVAAESEGYVPAELEASVKDALIEAFSNDEPLTGKLIKQTLHNAKPLSEAFKEDFDKMREWAENNARPAGKVKAGAPPMVRTRQRTAPTGERHISI